MSENSNHNQQNEKEKENEEINIGEINYSFTNFNNDNSNSNKKKEKEISNRKSLTKGKILGGQFILGEEIGKGTFGVVRLATHIITNEKVAVKMLYKERILNEESAKKRLEKEIKILKVLRHRNIVQLYNVFQTSSTIFLVMEHIQGKELFEIIVKKKKLSELESLLYFQQLISGIEYLAKLGIAHRDLKPENLMIDSRKVLNIAAFGLSNTYKKNELLSTPCGSPSYAAPEMLSGEKYWGLGADIWSCGIILYTMLCGRLPFEDKDNIKLYEKIKEGNFIIPEFLSENAKDFLTKILVVDPKKRYNITQIKKHPWFNQLDQKRYMSRGLLLNKFIVPIDEEIVEKMRKEYEYNEKEIRMNLLANKHNHITTTYYLFLKQKIKNGKHSISDMVHSEFINYVHNPKNFLANYNGDWNKLFKERATKKFTVEKGNCFSKRNSRKIDINDDKVISNNLLSSKKNEINLNEDKNIINNNNEFKEKIEEINKRRSFKLMTDNNNNKIEEDKKEEIEDKNKLQEIKKEIDFKNIENSETEKLITINLGELKSDKIKINLTPLNSKKQNKITDSNKTKKLHANISNKTVSNYSINNSGIPKNKPNSEFMKKPQAPISKFKTSFQKKYCEENMKKNKRKTISIKIKNINISLKSENKNNSKTKKIKTMTNIDSKNNNKKRKNNSINIINNIPNKNSFK